MRRSRKEGNKPVELLIPRRTLSMKASEAREELEKVRELGFPLKAAELKGRAEALEDLLVEHGKAIHQSAPNEVELHGRLKFYKQRKKSLPKG